MDKVNTLGFVHQNCFSPKAYGLFSVIEKLSSELLIKLIALSLLVGNLILDNSNRLRQCGEVSSFCLHEKNFLIK